MKKDEDSLGVKGNLKDELDLSLRPKKLSEYVGQDKIKDNLKVFMRSSKIRKEPMEHILIYGPPGLGKTTLANVLANEMNVNIKVTSGAAIDRAGDLASILSNLEEGDILFIDEIHRLNKAIEEVLYPVMEDYALDLIIGKGPGAKSIRVDLPKFTLIGATTRISLISSPLRDRFGIHQHIDFYSEKEIEDILKRSAGILKIDIGKDALQRLSKCSRQTPRVANRILKRVRDFALVKAGGDINQDILDESLNALGIDEVGLDPIDRKVLMTIARKYSGGPVGIETLSASSAIERSTIEDVIEPYLLQIGFIERTPRGRKTTPEAHRHLQIRAGQGALL